MTFKNKQKVSYLNQWKVNGKCLKLPLSDPPPLKQAILMFELSWVCHDTTRGRQGSVMSTAWNPKTLNVHVALTRAAPFVYVEGYFDKGVTQFHLCRYGLF